MSSPFFLQRLVVKHTEDSARLSIVGSVATCQNQAYLEQWAEELGVADLWKRIRDAVFPEHEERPA